MQSVPQAYGYMQQKMLKSFGQSQKSLSDSQQRFGTSSCTCPTQTSLWPLSGTGAQFVLLALLFLFVDRYHMSGKCHTP